MKPVLRNQINTLLPVYTIFYNNLLKIEIRWKVLLNVIVA